jgi:hypothetical protein
MRDLAIYAWLLHRTLLRRRCYKGAYLPAKLSEITLASLYGSAKVILAPKKPTVSRGLIFLSF